MKFKISLTGNPFYNQGVNKPLFYNQVLRDKNKWTYEQTIETCKKLFISDIFYNAKEYSGEIYKTLDYYTYEIIIPSSETEILAARYVAMTLTNETQERYYDVVSSKYVNESSTLITITCDKWVSYFDKITFDENKLVEITRKMPKRYDYRGLIDFTLESENHYQDDLDPPKSLMIDKVDLSVKERIDFSLTPYTTGEPFLHRTLDVDSDLINTYCNRNGMYFYGVFKSNQDFERNGEYDEKIDKGIPNNFVFAPILFATKEQIKKIHPTLDVPSSGGGVDKQDWSNNTYNNIATTSSSDLIDIIAIPIPPPKLILWFLLDSTPPFTEHDYYTNYGQANYSGNSNEGKYINVFGGDKLLPYSPWLDSINEQLSDHNKMIIPTLDSYGSVKTLNAGLNQPFNRENEPIFFHSNITEYTIRNIKDESSIIPLEYLKPYKSSYLPLARFNYNGVFLIVIYLWIFNILDDEFAFKFQNKILTSSPSVSDPWNDYLRNNKWGMMTGIAKQAVNVVSGGITDTAKGAAAGGLVGGAVGAASSAVKSAFSIADTYNNIRKIQRKAGENKHKNVDESTDVFTMLDFPINNIQNSVLGRLQIKQPLKRFTDDIINHCRIFGNPIKRFLNFKDWSSFQTRIYWDYWEIATTYFSFNINELPQGMDDYFTSIFKEVRLFPILDDGSTKLNDFSFENWEVGLIK